MARWWLILLLGASIGLAIFALGVGALPASILTVVAVAIVWLLVRVFGSTKRTVLAIFAALTIAGGWDGGPATAIISGLIAYAGGWLIWGAITRARARRQPEMSVKSKRSIGRAEDRLQESEEGSLTKVSDPVAMLDAGHQQETERLAEVGAMFLAGKPLSALTTGISSAAAADLIDALALAGRIIEREAAKSSGERVPQTGSADAER